MEEQTNKQRIVQQPEDDPIKRISARYERNALWVVMGLTLAILLGLNVARDTRGPPLSLSRPSTSSSSSKVTLPGGDIPHGKIPPDRP